MKHRLTLSELSARIEAEIREHFKQMREYPSLVWVGREVLPWSMRPRSFKLDSGREIPIRLRDGRAVSTRVVDPSVSNARNCESCGDELPSNRTEKWCAACY